SHKRRPPRFQIGIDLLPITPFLTAYLTFVALVLGSFINLAADRLPRGESILWPRSHCRACGRQLNAVDLLPVLGYAVRRGRSATNPARRSWFNERSSVWEPSRRLVSKTLRIWSVLPSLIIDRTATLATSTSYAATLPPPTAGMSCW